MTAADLSRYVKSEPALRGKTVTSFCEETGFSRQNVYVISIDGARKIKRLSTLKDGVRIISDNESRYPAEDFRGDECDRVRIYGRVIEVTRPL